MKIWNKILTPRTFVGSVLVGLAIYLLVRLIDPLWGTKKEVTTTVNDTSQQRIENKIDDSNKVVNIPSYSEIAINENTRKPVNAEPNKPPISRSDEGIIIQKDETKNSSNKPGESGTENDIDTYINKTTIKNHITVLVIDNNNHLLNSISSDIAGLYRSKGYSVTTSLFTNSFLNSTFLSEVQSANSRILDKLGLASYTDYIVIGKYSNEFDTGEMLKWISRATLDVTVISCKSKSQIDGFQIAVSNGFDDKQHAEKGAKEKIMLTYKASHLNL